MIKILELETFILKSFNCRTAVKNLFNNKNANHLGIVKNREKTCKKHSRKHQGVFILKIWSVTDLFHAERHLVDVFFLITFLKIQIRNFLSQGSSENVTVASIASFK